MMAMRISDQAIFVYYLMPLILLPDTNACILFALERASFCHKDDQLLKQIIRLLLLCLTKKCFCCMNVVAQ